MTELKEKNIILASTSPIRKQMLEELGIEFEAISPECDEDALKDSLSDLPLPELAVELAKAKALSISKNNPDSYVIGSDQICEIDGKTISKSKDQKEAFESLKSLQGKTHTQNNGTVIYKGEKLVFENKETVKLKMRDLSDEEIWNYIEIDNPIGCAGSYKFELNGYKLFDEINGSEDAIKGFAATKVLEFLKSV